MIRASGGIYYAPGFRSRLIAYGFTNSNSISSSTGYAPIYNWTTVGISLEFPARAVHRSFFPERPIGQLDSAGHFAHAADSHLDLQYAARGGPQPCARGTYVGSHSTHLILGGSLSNMNTLDPKYLSLGNLLFQDISSPPRRPPESPRRIPAFTTSAHPYRGPVAAAVSAVPERKRRVGSARHRRFNSLQLKATKRYSSGLTLLAFYTWSKNMTNSDTGPIDLGPGEGAIQNPTNRAGEVSVSTDGPPHVFVASGSYELPFGAGKRFLSRNHVARPRRRRMADYGIRPLCQRLGAGDHRRQRHFGAWLSQHPRPTTSAAIRTRRPNPRDFDPARDVYLNSAAFATPSTFALGNTARVLDWVRGF